MKKEENGIFIDCEDMSRYMRRAFAMGNVFSCVLAEISEDFLQHDCKLELGEIVMVGATAITVLLCSWGKLWGCRRNT